MANMRKRIEPKEWIFGAICPKYKKNDKLIYDNYRGITLLNTAYKLLTKMLHNKFILTVS